jgi:hypothetical protein
MRGNHGYTPTQTNRNQPENIEILTNLIRFLSAGLVPRSGTELAQSGGRFQLAGSFPQPNHGAGQHETIGGNETHQNQAKTEQAKTEHRGRTPRKAKHPGKVRTQAIHPRLIKGT